MGELVVLNGVTSLNIPADRVLDQAKGKLDYVVLVGWDKEGELYFASSVADGGEVLWLFEKAKIQLLEVDSDA